MSDLIKFYSIDDWSGGDHLSASELIIKNFDVTVQYDDINKIIELYNIKKFFDNGLYLPSWDEKTRVEYTNIVKKFNRVIGKFFSTINGDNLVGFFNNVQFEYRLDFWDLIEYFNVHTRITSNQFFDIIKSPNVLHCVLHCKKIVQCFGQAITKELIATGDCTETLITYYMCNRSNEKRRIYVPYELTQEDKQEILMKYINSNQANPNYLSLISNFKRGDEFCANDKIRYAAHKKYHEFWENEKNKKDIVWHSYGTNVVFFDNKKQEKLASKRNDNIVEFTYDTSWINENLDYPTLLNNFIYLFGFVDEQGRYQHLSNPANFSVLERELGLSGLNEYKTGIDYQIRKMASIGQMAGYISQLKLNNIRIEDIFKWFFEEYLVEEFNAKGFCYFAPSQNASWLEKSLLLITQFDSIAKQFRFYIEEKIVGREYFEFSSDYYKLSDTPSMVSKKYVYPKSNRILLAMYKLFSDQSMLYYVGKEIKYKNLPHMLSSQQMRIADFKRYQKPDIERLISEGFAFVDEHECVRIKNEVAYLLQDLFQNGVISYHHYKNHFPFMVNLIEEWIKTGDLATKQSLLTDQEQQFIDFMLNVQKYNNGPELRNKYAHGIFPSDEKLQEQNYVELLRLMVLLIIKINEEFCIVNPETNCFLE